jgi:hypothetical protein
VTGSEIGSDSVRDTVFDFGADVVSDSGSDSERDVIVD